MAIRFKGTVRSNLDPFKEHTDDELWHSLEYSGIKETVSGMEGQLEGVVEENGTNFSLGQKQLFCLARVILKKSSILCLDEASSALDLASDAFIQKQIRTLFKDRTVLTIAHRLDTIIDSDVIVFLDRGQIVEMGPVLELLSDKKGHFYGLVAETGLNIDELKKQLEVTTKSPSVKAKKAKGKGKEKSTAEENGSTEKLNVPPKRKANKKSSTRVE